MPEVGIVMTLKDRISTSMKSMMATGQSLSKEFEQLYDRVERTEAQQTALAKKIAETKSSITQQTDTVKASKKAWDDLRKSDSATEEAIAEKAAAFQRETEQLEILKNQLNEYTESSKDARAEMRELSSEWRKMRQETGTAGSSAGGASKETGMVASLKKAGLTKLIGDSISQFAGVAIESALGQPTASLVSSIASGAVTGAAMGSIIPGIGTAVGAAIGAGAGLITGGSQVLSSHDEAFKEYYKGLYEEVNAATAESISSGSTIAAGRETDRLSFATLLGDEERAEDFLSGLVNMANHTPFLYDDLTAMSKAVATYGFKDQLGAGETGYEILDTLQKVGDAGAALGMSTSDMTSVATALGRMLSSDKASLEYLNILNDRGIGAVGYLAEARGKSIGDTYTDISKGNISGGEAVEIILRAMERDFAGAMEDQSKTFSGLSSTLEGLRQEVDNAAGEGYNNLRGGGIEDEIASLDGPLGDALKKAAEVSGKNQAYLDNLSEQYQREALEAVLLGYAPSELFGEEDRAKLEELAVAYADATERYEAGSQEAGLEMESLKEQAEALAAAAYDSSEFVKQANDAQLDQIAAIRENTAALDGWRAALNEQEELSKGLAAGRSAKGLEDMDYQLPAQWQAYIEKQRANYQGEQSAAYGLDRVPYDGFPAVLHQGERVLTAREARAQDAQGPSGGGIQITVTGNSFQGTGEEMADQLAEILARRLEQAAIVAAPR